MSLRTLAIALPLALTTVGSAQYVVTDLGALPSATTSHGYKINDAGQVVGFSSTSQGARGFLWSQRDGMRNLGVLRSDPSSFAMALDNHGRVVGYSGSGVYQSAFQWTASGGLQDLGTIGSDNQSLAIDTNDSGQTVGVSALGSTLRRAFLYQQSTGMVDLGFVPGRSSSFARGINEAGFVVGHSAGSDSLAFLWKQTTGMVALQNLAGGVSSAFEINDSNTIVGWSKDALGVKHAVKWAGTGFAPIALDTNSGANGTEALAVNNAGRAVGYGVFQGQERAMIFDPTLGAMRLDAMLGAAGNGWVFQRAQSINSSGAIVGFGIVDGQTHAFMASPVPEPATFGVLALGLLMVKRRRKSR